MIGLTATQGCGNGRESGVPRGVGSDSGRKQAVQ